MAITYSVRPVGPTYALSVAATQTAAIAVATPVGDMGNYAEFLNTGATTVCVVLAPFAATPATPTLVFPVAGTPTVPNSFMLPPLMTMPRPVPVPSNGFCVSAIGSGAGPALVYITPVSQL